MPKKTSYELLERIQTQDEILIGQGTINPVAFKTPDNLVMRRPFVVCIYRGIALADTNQPSTVQEVFNSTEKEIYLDLRKVTKVKIHCNITTIGDEKKADGTLTCASAIAGDTVTVNGLLYTAVAGVKADDTEFSIDTSNDATATDLADSIDDDTRTGTLDDLTATATTNVVTAVSTVTGTEGNAITLAETGGTITLSGATFSGGQMSEMGVQYSADDGTTWKGIDNDTTNGISDIFVKLGVLGQKKSAFMTIKSSALIEECLIRVITAEGDGTKDPAYTSIDLEFQ